MVSFNKKNFINFIGIGVPIAAAFCILYLFVYKIPLDMRNLLKNTKYTVATVIHDWHYKNNHGTGVDYEYFVNGKYYYKTSNIRVQKGEQYILVYDSLNPNTHCLLTYYELTDSITPPKNGWKYEEIPIEIDSAEIREYIEKWK